MQAYGGEQKVVDLLKEQGMTMELLKRSIRSQTLSDRAAEIVTKEASVSDAEIQAYWEAHKAELAQAEEDGDAGQGQDHHRADPALRQEAAALERVGRGALRGAGGRVRGRVRPGAADAVGVCLAGGLKRRAARREAGGD